MSYIGSTFKTTIFNVDKFTSILFNEFVQIGPPAVPILKQIFNMGINLISDMILNKFGKTTALVIISGYLKELAGEEGFSSWWSWLFRVPPLRASTEKKLLRYMRG